MNNFDAVFTVVQKHCSNQETILGVGQLEKIAAEAGIKIDRLYFYLESLSNMGLLHYSYNDKKVSLTDEGKKTTFVFP